MKKNIRWIFFDIGGVLADESVDTKFRKDLDLKIIRSFGVDISIDDIEREWSRASAMLGSLDKNILEIFLEPDFTLQAFEKFKAERKKHSPYERLIKIKPEAKQILEKLARKYKLGIIANQPIVMREMLQEVKIAQYFSFLGLSNEYGLHKPDLKFFEQVLKDSGANPNESAMVDDNIERGLLPAKQFGFATVWVNDGNKNREIPAEIDFVVNSLDGLKEVFFESEKSGELKHNLK